jgi:amino acid permease
MTGKVDQASLQSALYKAGYFVFLVVFLVAVLLSMRVALLQRNRVKQSHLTVSPPWVCTSQSIYIFQRTHTDHSQIVRWLLLVTPFLALRTAYGMLGMFEATGANMFTSMWSSLFGSATAFALMALLPEYIIVCIYIRVLHFRVRTCREMDQLLGESRDGAGHEMSGKSVAGNFRVRG